MQKAWTPAIVVLACMASFVISVQRAEEVSVVLQKTTERKRKAHPTFSPHKTPQILQFSCSVVLYSREIELVQQLKNGDESSQLEAAKKLWKGHHRSYAEAVLKFLEESKSQSPELHDFRREVEVSLQPESILTELKEGDYKWGAWLAYLRPHESLVPVLLEDLKNDQQKEELAETLIALGKSNDRRAIEPLIHILLTEDYYDSWAAATAIGLVEIEIPGLEDQLLACLPKKCGLAAAEVCDVLGKIGTKKSLPNLQEIAAIKNKGAIDVADAAKSAINKINQRTIVTPAPAP